jgi:hypothetical protein
MGRKRSGATDDAVPKKCNAEFWQEAVAHRSETKGPISPPPKPRSGWETPAAKSFRIWADVLKRGHAVPDHLSEQSKAILHAMKALLKTNEPLDQ